MASPSREAVARSSKSLGSGRSAVIVEAGRNEKQEAAFAAMCLRLVG